jgi:RNA polymerase sigma factor (sigma-70 family)
MYSNEQIIEAFRTGDDKILKYIYNKCYYSIQHFIIKNKGTKSDAKDIYHDAWVVIFKKSHNSDFVIKASFLTYLYAVCRFLWLKELRSRRRTIEDNKNEYDDDFLDEYANNEMDELRLKIFWKHFYELDVRCQEVLRNYMNETPVAEIRKTMGFTNDQGVMDKKYYCKKLLIYKILNNQTYKEIFDHDLHIGYRQVS